MAMAFFGKLRETENQPWYYHQFKGTLFSDKPKVFFSFLASESNGSGQDWTSIMNNVWTCVNYSEISDMQHQQAEPVTSRPESCDLSALGVNDARCLDVCSWKPSQADSQNSYSNTQRYTETFPWISLGFRQKREAEERKAIMPQDSSCGSCSNHGRHFEPRKTKKTKQPVDLNPRWRICQQSAAPTRCGAAKCPTKIEDNKVSYSLAVD